MKPALALLILLLGGCATQQTTRVEPRPLQIVGGMTMAEWKDLGFSDHLGPPLHGIDMRWGKCEEHGEYWDAVGGYRHFTRGHGAVHLILVCPGPPWHYYMPRIGAEVEGPKEKEKP